MITKTGGKKVCILNIINISKNQERFIANKRKNEQFGFYFDYFSTFHSILPDLGRKKEEDLLS